MRTLPSAALCTFLVPLTVACGGEQASQEAGTSPHVLEVTARDFGFEMPAEVPSGWTTIRFTNTGEQEHFVYFYRLPDAVSFTRYKKEVTSTFGRVWNEYASGQLTREETLRKLGEELPGWFMTGIVPAGGVALTEPGETAESTVRLEPGTYGVECYVKTPKGTWHVDRGMLRELVVTDATNGYAPPKADVEVTLSSYEIELSGPLSAGTRTVAVRATDRPEGLMAHDLNLFRLEAEETVEEIVAWMDWMDLDRFRAPAPAYSLGGVEHVAPGRTGYMTVDLEPGRYAFVSEEYGSRGMVHEFTIQ